MSTLHWLREQVPMEEKVAVMEALHKALLQRDELLAVLRELVAQADTEPFMSIGFFVEHMSGARAAIAKAEGV